MNNEREEKEINVFLQKIMQWILFLKKDIPNIAEAFIGVQFEDYESILQALLLGLKKEERKIAKEREGNYVTDSYENGVRWFTNRLCVVLAKEYEKIKDCNGLEALLNQRHIAYSCYHNCYYGEMEKPTGFRPKHEKATYLGLIDFYSKFYGRFSDNEEAIVLLCVNYSSGMLSEEEENKLVEALASHIRDAGTINDIGYAYHGIEKIETHIKELPERVVEKVIGEYELVRVLNDKVSRHQLYSLIEASVLQEKHKMKFWCIDSLYIANYINLCLLDILKDRNKDVKVCYSTFDITVKEEKIPVFTSPNASWEYTRRDERRLYIEGDSFIRVFLREDKIVIQRDRNRNHPLVLAYQYDDWQMEIKCRSEIEEWLRKVYSLSPEKDENNMQMAFSLVYLENYRGISKQIFDFDHKIKYETDTGKLSVRKENEKKVAQYYGENVYSLSCIVGKNGAGKSSVVDFLRETFFGLLMTIMKNPKACENGYMSESAYNKDSEIFDLGAKFLVVCRFGEEMFYLTNMKMVGSGDISPLTFACLPKDTDELSKIVYFSNMLRVNQKELFMPDELNKGSERPDTIKLLTKNFKQATFSETKSFILKQRAIDEINKSYENAKKEPNEKIHYNKELCYQLFMASQFGEEEIEKHMEYCVSKTFTIRSEYFRKEGQPTTQEKQEVRVPFSFNELRNDRQKVNDIIVQFKNCPDAQIEFFSSGEYVKFAFLSKLNWLLNGIRYKRQLFSDIIKMYDFDMEECLQVGDTALIFIDEGELYYHPEWQRQYLSTLLEMINKVEGIKVQIVLTTNSPFILSDVLGEDVLYLDEEEKEKFKESTLGQNIHQLLTGNFFMKCTIGEYVRQFIQDIQNLITRNLEDVEISKKYFGKEKCTYENIRQAIDMLGETVYRYGLEKMLFSLLEKDKNQKLYELERKKHMLEEEICRLKGETND